MSRVGFIHGIFRCGLAIFLAGALLEPISSSASGEDPATATVPSCDATGRATGPLREELTLTLTPGEDSVSFMCSSSQQTTRQPEEGKVYGDDCSSDEDLTSVFERATLDEEHETGNQKTTYKLTVPKTSRTARKVLCYKCAVNVGRKRATESEGRQPEAGNECKVKITVEQVEQTTPEPEENAEQQAGPIECTGSDTMKEASVSAESPLSFKCGAGMSLHPTNLTDVFDDQDGKCAAEVALQTLVDATLTKTDAEATHNEQPVYRLVVKTAPPEDTALCYKCVPSSPSETEIEIQSEGESTAKECLLKISVKGSASSAFSPTWGPAHGAAAFFVAAQLLRGMVGA
ncbi:SRS domain-containing protein [Neospora caninum Liverpool]|uniref:SRS domain-containing protein n=1 Tax=Neospora caninum (strain Liverpool) TaxID=572307 RepID=F0VL95_NEOCL|nr:SRS domain-containing protein [Neospora caninum Liverpool]CBZ54847.1 SRS domain-containing protein [Neospora caninum Liverpool]CEL69566.1 TPA: SRS domain-containing protein [Neospora caninum Liverpool]|eukprot:XP_003884875.1 SRS domain-containing protein [Neospora caninum Liverpool]